MLLDDNGALVVFSRYGNSRKKASHCSIKMLNGRFPPTPPHTSENKIRAQVFFQILILPLMRNKKPSQTTPLNRFWLPNGFMNFLLWENNHIPFWFVRVHPLMARYLKMIVAFQIQLGTMFIQFLVYILFYTMPCGTYKRNMYSQRIRCLLDNFFLYYLKKSEILTLLPT